MKDRFTGIVRNYTYQDVVRLRGSKQIAYTLATDGANKLWKLAIKLCNKSKPD